MSKVAFELKWLSVTCFEMKFGGVTVVTDPYVTECVGTDLTWEAIENCDMICISHAHWDHITDIPRLVDKFHPLIMCGEQTAMPMAKWLDYTPSRIYPMYPNLELDFDEVKIKALYGRHTDLKEGYNQLETRISGNPICSTDAGMASLQGIGCMEYRNFLFTLPNGTKILLWGNDPTVEQRNICKALQPDVVIMQRSVKPEDIVKKAEFAAALGCKVLIPHHHDFRCVESPNAIDAFEREFLKRVPDGRFIRPKHGEWIQL